MAEAAHSTTALTLADLDTRVNGEPRLSHHRLSAVLAYGSPHKMAHLVERHMETLYRFGILPSTVDRTLKNNDKSGGRPGKTYWLNKKQALFLCTKSEAPLATETTIQMVEVFDAWQSGHLVAVDRPELRPGLMWARVGKREVLVDFHEYRIGPADEALVLGYEGKIMIMRGPFEANTSSPWLGKRASLGPWKKPGPKSMRGVSAERANYSVIGRLVTIDEQRRRLAA